MIKDRVDHLTSAQYFGERKFMRNSLHGGLTFNHVMPDLIRHPGFQHKRQKANFTMFKYFPLDSGFRRNDIKVSFVVGLKRVPPSPRVMN
jgi:hypothetical protein